MAAERGLFCARRGAIDRIRELVIALDRAEGEAPVVQGELGNGDVEPVRRRDERWLPRGA